MKIKSFIVFVGCLCVSLGAAAEQWRFGQTEPDLIDVLLMPIEPTPEGIQHYLETVYNAPGYAHEVIPYDLSHLGQLLQLGTDRDDCKSILLLFKKKIAQAPCVSGYMAISAVQELTQLLERYYDDDAERLEQKKVVQNTLYDSFAQDFESFRAHPDFFFDRLASRIVDDLDQLTSDQEISPEHLTLAVVRFVDTLLSNVAWDLHDEQLWDAVIQLAQVTHELYEHSPHMFDEDFNDLLWVLAHRFARFIELAGSDVPIAAYEAMRLDLDEAQQVLVSFEEGEELIETKHAYLTRVLVEGCARSYAAGQCVTA